MPLAHDVRPKTIEEFIGQEHIVGTNGPVQKMIRNRKLSNIILYGPPGVGKTTLAEILANEFKLPFYKANASLANLQDLKDIIDLSDKKGESKFILFVDELHLFRKNIQQFLLDYIEKGKIVLIGSTAENPYFTIHKAILSRCNVFQLNPLTTENIVVGIKRCVEILKKEYSDYAIVEQDETYEAIAKMANGDMRCAINKLELIFTSAIEEDIKFIDLSINKISESMLSKAYRYDRDGDEHYNALSAFMKSLRGSDPDAAIHYLARLIKAGDLQGICRRLLCSASEDVGLANPQAIYVVKSCVDSALQLGFPEARIPLAEATIFLAISPKSNSAISAIDRALSDLETKDIGDIPNHLKDAHYAGATKLGHGVEYKYPHDYTNHYVKQQYLPHEIANRKYYIPQDNKTEKSYDDYWNNIKKKS